MEQELQETMFAHVRAWQAGEMTKKDFAQSLGMSRHKFEYWHKKYQQMNNVENWSADFIQLEAPSLTNKSVRVENTQQAKKPKLEIELSLSRGFSFKIYS